jgi:hypothetical protein
VDGSGAAVPGATVNATEASTGTVRSGVSNEQGLFRMAALNPGRYTLNIELASFRSVTVTDINLLSSETRDLGKLTLEVGAVSEIVSVTSEVTPVQVADSSRRSTITVDDIANIQTKGRDMFGLLAILPGVQDTNLNRDFAQWRSAISITINGMPSQSKDVRVDGLNIVDEGGCGTAFVNLNMDAIGEVQVIANGYTAENGRNNGGLISIVTKSGSGMLKGSAWYNGRRDKFNENDYFREASNTAKPLYRVNISGYGLGGPVVIPGLVDSRSGKGASKKFYFFVSQEYTDDARPTTISRANMPTALERAGDFSQTRITNGTIQPIIDPNTGVAFQGNVIPANRINSLGQRMLNQLPTANGITNPTVGQEWTSNSMYDLTPVHGRTNHVLRLDAVLSEKTRFNFRLLNHSRHRVRQPEHARTPVIHDDDSGRSAHRGQRNEFRVHPQPVGLQGCGRLRLSEPLPVDAGHRPAEIRTVWPGHESAGVVGLWRRASGRVAIRAKVQHHRRQSREPRQLPGW